MKTPAASALAVVLALTGCQQITPPASTTDAAGNTITEWPLPAAAGSAQPDLVLAPDGRLLLSWVKPFDKTRAALQFSTYSRDGQWQWAPKTIAVGATMVVDWADTPHIAATADGGLWAHWLQRTRGRDDAPDAGSHDIILARSSDDGMNWSAPIRAHDDGQAVEHGFVSFWPAARDRLGIAWLDGRDGAGAATHAAHAEAGTPASGATAATAPSGTTSLRAATVDATPRVLDAVAVDAGACEYCGTAVAMTARGPLLVYRGRSADEIRDIHATRFENGAWRAPQVVHADNWKMTACPVNGPAVGADGSNAVVAWYTAANGTQALHAARSADAGDTFGAVVAVDTGEAVLGRAAIAVDATQAWIAWLREDGSGQSLWVARYTPDLTRQLAKFRVAALTGRGNGTGFPKLVARDGEAFVVWTDLAGGAPQLHGARVRGP